ncbi:MAG: metal ABC transporter permease [Chitinophagales bacterium]
MNAFWIILTGSLVATSCGLLGCYLILRKMSMVGDAISHAVLPGIFLAFWLTTSSHASVFMLMGAAIFGIITTVSIEMLSKQGNMQTDAAIGVTFTFLFAIGVILISMFADSVHLDQDCVLYGEILLVPFDTTTLFGITMPRAVWTMLPVLIGIIAMIIFCYKALFLTTFDPAFASILGISVSLWHYVLMSAVSLTTVLAFESVGAILVVAFLIGPAATAYLLTDKLHIMLVLSAIIGVLTAIFGYYLAAYLDSSIAGAMATVLGGLFAMALFFSPKYGIVTRKFRKVELMEKEVLV